MIGIGWYESKNTEFKGYCGIFVTAIDEQHKPEIHEQCIAIVWGWA